jgi:uncharacterized membrane protein YbhN (UPF0104 family)
MIERLTGMFALGLFAFIALLFGFSVFTQIPMVWLSLSMLLFAFIVFLGVLHPRVSGFIHALLENSNPRSYSFLNKGIDKLKKLFGTLLVYQKNKRILGIAFLLAILLQINVVFHFYFLSFALNFSVPLLYYFLIIPVTTVVLLLPVFINGIGAREAIYIFFLSKFQVTSPQAIAFTWITFGMVLFQGIIGGIIYALRR